MINSEDDVQYKVHIASLQEDLKAPPCPFDDIVGQIIQNLIISRFQMSKRRDIAS